MADECLDEQAALALATARGTESNRARAMAHVDHCDACRQLVGAHPAPLRALFLPTVRLHKLVVAIDTRDEAPSLDLEHPGRLPAHLIRVDLLGHFHLEVLADKGQAAAHTSASDASSATTIRVGSGATAPTLTLAGRGAGPTTLAEPAVASSAAATALNIGVGAVRSYVLLGAVDRIEDRRLDESLHW